MSGSSIAPDWVPVETGEGPCACWCAHCGLKIGEGATPGLARADAMRQGHYLAGGEMYCGRGCAVAHGEMELLNIRREGY